MAEITENVNIPETIEMTRSVSPGGDFEVQVTVDVSDTASAHNAEAWAVGRRGGVPVSSTDETYHNNAEYYAQQAAAPVVTILAPSYSDLTFPVEKGTPCTYQGDFYYAKQDINSSESFTPGHWQETTAGEYVDIYLGLVTASVEETQAIISEYGT